MATKQLKATAYLEAEHAVVNLRCGINFEYVTIKPVEDSLADFLVGDHVEGVVTLQALTGDESEFVEERIQSSMIGRIAQKICTPRCYRPYQDRTET